MRQKFKVFSVLFAIVGLVLGWNLQSKQIAEALLGSNSFVSTTSAGALANSGATYASISHDGRYVAFSSGATNLVPNDSNAKTDIFLKDVSTNAITRVSVDSSGNQANNESYRTDTDTEGRFVVFTTKSTNLASVTDSNANWDVVLKDMDTGSVNYISQSDAGTIGNNSSGSPAISCDGRFIVFSSNANNLVNSDSNGWGDVFLTDLLVTQTVQNITLGANSWSEDPDISCNGNYVSFTSRATNFGVKPSTGTNTYDVYRYNRSSSIIDAASSRQDGSTPTGSSVDSTISSDGRYIIYSSTASDMITPGTDANGTAADLFLRDMNTTGFRIVNQTNTGANGSHAATQASFSGTNRIAYTSNATNLVSGVNDTNGTNPDIFIVDVGTPDTCTF